MACAEKGCAVQDGETWPGCIGPSGCMRNYEAPPPLANISKPVPPIKTGRKIWKTSPKPKPKSGPQRSYKPRPGKKSVSINGKLHGRFKAVVKAKGISMSSVLEAACQRYFGDY